MKQPSAANITHQEAAIDDSHPTHHILSPAVYGTILGILFVLTALTVAVAYVEFGGVWNLVVALCVATLKATLVILWFMHVKFSGRLIHVVLGASLLFFAILICGVMMDVYSRSNVHLDPTGSTLVEQHPSQH